MPLCSQCQSQQALVTLSVWPTSPGIGVHQLLFVALFLFKKSNVSDLQTDSSLINFTSSKLNHLLIKNLSADRLMQLKGKVMPYYYDLCICLLTTISGAHTPHGHATAMPASSSNLFHHFFHLPDVVNPHSFGSS